MRQLPPTRYLYIVSRGYSGSTILSILVGQSNTVASEGEIVSGFHDNYEAKRCANREIFAECLFWRQVKSGFERRAGMPFADGVRLLNTNSHYARLIPNLLASSRNPKVLEEKRLREALYDSISEVWDRPVVLDSSKEIAAAVFLLRHVRAFKLIHVVRHPFGVVDSYVKRAKRGQRFVMFKRRFHVKHYFLPMVIAAMVWTLENLFCELLRIACPARMMRLHYEDLCNDPAGSLESLERFTGVPLTASKAAAATRLPLHPGHALSGNPMMRSKEIVFAPKIGAPRELTAFDKVIVTLCTLPLMLAYGYFGRRSGKSAAVARGPSLTT